METIYPSAGEETWFPLKLSTLEKGAGSLQIPAPLLRISACGMLSVEILCEVRETPALVGRYHRLSEEQMRGRNCFQALTLLKLLLSRPHRYAPKDALMEHLGSSEQAISQGRLDDLASQLRGLLCGKEWEHLRRQVVQYVHGSSATGNGYRLAPYPLIWLDIDALAWYVEQACRLERFGSSEEACALWEQAYQFASRGDYLCDEAYSDWSESRRAEVARGRRLCVHALSRLLLATAGEAGEAQVLHLLSAYCSEYPLDEDVLRPLMELLGKHERFSEALSLYEHACHLLAEDGLTPDEKTNDIAQMLRSKQLFRQSTREKARNTASSSHRALTLSSHQLFVPNTDFAHSVAKDIMKVIRELEGVAELNFSDLMHRRAVLAHLFKIPAVALATDTLSPDLLDDTMKLQEEALSSLYEDMLIMGWDSFRRSKSPQIITRIDEHVNKLTILARSASLGDAAHWQSLLCRFSQLSTRIAQHRFDEPRALTMAKQAIMIAIDLDNVELIAATFYSRGRVYLEYYQTATEQGQKKKYFERAKADVDAALGHIERVRAPLAGNIYLLAAEIYAQTAGTEAILQTQCKKWQDQVEVLLLGNIEDDGTFLQLNATALHHEKAKTLLRFGKIEEAHSELHTAWKTLQPNLFTWHMNMYLTQATLFLAEQDIEASAQACLKAHMLAKTIHSHKGEREVQRLLEDLAQQDKTNASVRELAATLEVKI